MRTFFRIVGVIAALFIGFFLAALISINMIEYPKQDFFFVDSVVDGLAYSASATVAVIGLVFAAIGIAKLIDERTEE